MNKLFRWVIFIAGAFFIAFIFVIWKDLERKYLGYSLFSAFLRGAICCGGIIYLFNWARSNPQKIEDHETSVNENTGTDKVILEAKLRSSQSISKITTAESEVKQQDEEFIALLKAAVKENGPNKIPGDDLIEIYNRAKSTEASNNIPDIELSKAIETVLEEIKKRGLSQDIKPQSNRQQDIHHFKDYSFKQNETGESSKWLYVTAISIIVISIALVVISNFSSHNLSQDEIAQINGRAGLHYGNRYTGNLYNGNSNVTLEQVTIDITTSINGIKQTRTYSVDVNIPPLTTKDFGIGIVVGDAGAEYQWSINSARGH